MSSNRTLFLSATLIGAMASLASCSDDDELLNRAPDADAGASSLGGASSTGLGGRGGGSAIGGSGGVTTNPVTTAGGSTTTAVGGTTSMGSAGTAAGLGGVGGITSIATSVSTGGAAVITSAGSSAIGGSAAAGASGHAGMAGNPNQAGASGIAGAGGVSQKSPLELACEAVCSAQATLSCAISNCPSECATFGAAVDAPDAYLAMVQCEAQSITTADGYFCSDQNPMVSVGLEAPSPKVQGDSACRTQICDYTCNESTFYDPTVCTACACPSGC